MSEWKILLNVENAMQYMELLIRDVGEDFRGDLHNYVSGIRDTIASITAALDNFSSA